MTREEEIKEAAKKLELINMNTPLIGIIAIQGAEWADKHPRKGLWDKEKVITWIALHAELYGGFNQGKLNSMCEDLRKAMEN